MLKTITLICKKIFDWCVGNIVLLTFLVIGLYLYNITLEYSPRVVFMDVGQGDAILLVDSSGKKILIDGGSGNYVVYSIGKYFHPKDRFIDVVILTHPHEDHLSGIIDILERYDVGEILYYPACYNSSLYRYFLNLDENISVVDTNYIFEGKSFVLKLLYPLEQVSEDECVKFPNVNNASIVMKFDSDAGSFLLTGDAEHEVENWLMKKYSKKELKVDVLKAGHHCSRTASSRSFVNFVEPKYAICSVGKENKFGHPHREVIEIFESFNIEYMLTYEEGDLVFDL
jgi:competence protein ComEC